VSARIGNRVKSSINIEHRDLLPANFNRFAGTRRNVILMQNFDKLSHILFDPPRVYTLKELPHPHEPVAFRLVNLKPASFRSST